MSADFEVERVLVGKVLLITRTLLLATEYSTTATAILARSGALGTLAIEMNAVSILHALYSNPKSLSRLGYNYMQYLIVTIKR
ncbi:hypothetical protein QUA42_24785 [Microcoleus sp. Pol11C2]|uniref:hypothetical protein n=1 Tax=Microcoleus sp. Pol11C2 TaxID=3055389 RepID=UPI002FD34C4E